MFMGANKMKILFASAECAPFFKTGGLGDVAGALPKELAKKGVDIRVVLPYFTKMPEDYKEQCEELFSFSVRVGWRNQYCGIKRLVMGNVTYYFIDNQYYFARDNLYGYYDDGERFAYFQQALIEMMERINFIPDVLHLNDYHTAMVPFLLKEKYRWIQNYRGIRTVLTIHNIEFQGKYSGEMLPELFGMGMERYHDGTVRLDDCLNFMKAGILYADRVNTVSPSYAEEIKTSAFGAGLEVILRMEAGKLRGIINGIDYDSFDPETDPALPAAFSMDDLTGKGTNKQALQQKMGLPIDENIPLLAVVSRLTYQKGFHLLLEEFPQLMQQEVQFVLLGTGDSEFEEQFRRFAHAYPEKCAVSISFDVQLAQQMYAGADIFLMPSAFEPCGLSQMMAMRYGTLPVVHEIGGLKDTVVPFNPVTGQGTGFGFIEFTAFRFLEAVTKAVDLYHTSQPAWNNLIYQAMSRDFSWATSSENYFSLYKELVKP